MNADIVGVLNIARKDGTIILSPSWRDRDNGVMTHPMLFIEAGTSLTRFSVRGCQPLHFLPPAQQKANTQSNR